MKQERIYFLDWLRVLACFMVMIVHASENFYLVPAEGAPAGEMVSVVSFIKSRDCLLWVSLLDGVCRMSVPLFMMTSAYLLCPMREGQTWGAFLKRRARRIIPPMLAFLVLYSALPLLWGGTTAGKALSDILYIPLNFPGNAGHLWFLYPLLSLYLLIPVLTPWLRKASARQELFVIGLFALSTTIPLFNHFGLDVFGQVYWNPYHALFPFSGYIGYLVLGHFIRFHIKWGARRRLAVGLPAFAAGAAFTVLSFFLLAEPGVEQKPAWVELCWTFCSPNVLLATFGFFLAMSAAEAARGKGRAAARPSALRAAVEDVSRKSYGMYLMHMFFLLMWSEILMPVLYVGLAIPAIAAATFVSSYAVTKAASLIPGSKWVVG